jgi:hypothetical protein
VDFLLTALLAISAWAGNPAASGRGELAFNTSNSNVF